MSLTLETYFLLFMIYAILGWCMEVICKLVERKKFINRGFLIGPYCPIYGWGAIAITILLKKYLGDPLILFAISVIICSFLEYFTSYFMEKKYQARWWDYSHKKFNINGRICLETMIPFGILGMIIMYFTNPIFLSWIEKIPSLWLHILTGILLFTYLMDNIVSSNIIDGIKKEGNKLTKDDTEEITERVKNILKQKSFLYRRLLNAYPNLKDIKLKRRKTK